MKLTVTIEEEDLDGFDVVDRIDIPLPTSTFSDSVEHTGEYGIATIRLGYSFVSVVNQNTISDSREGEEVLVHLEFIFDWKIVDHVRHTCISTLKRL